MKNLLPTIALLLLPLNSFTMNNNIANFFNTQERQEAEKQTNIAEINKIIVKYGEQIEKITEKIKGKLFSNKPYPTTSLYYSKETKECVIYDSDKSLDEHRDVFYPINNMTIFLNRKNIKLCRKLVDDMQSYYKKTKAIKAQPNSILAREKTHALCTITNNNKLEKMKNLLKIVKPKPFYHLKPNTLFSNVIVVTLK